MVRKSAKRAGDRGGTAAVEVAVIMPAFLTFVFGLIEYGHTRAVGNLLKSSVRSAARYGSTEGVSTTQVVERAQEIMAAMAQSADVTITVKNAEAYDQDGAALPSTPSEFNAMADIELSGATPRQLFLVRGEVSYNDVAIMPLWFMDNVTLVGTSFARHE